MKRIKSTKAKITVKPNIHIGDHFIYKDIEWICLDIIDGNYLAITAEVWKKLPFDVGNHNDWDQSSLRKILNNDFINILNKDYLIIQTSDMVADNGDRKYGSCEDYITILSCDQYRKYRDLVPCYPEWMWTLTPRSSYGGLVRIICPASDISNYGAYNRYGVAPVVLFSSEILKSPHLGIQKPNQLGGTDHK